MYLINKDNVSEVFFSDLAPYVLDKIRGVLVKSTDFAMKPTFKSSSWHDNAAEPSYYKFLLSTLSIER